MLWVISLVIVLKLPSNLVLYADCQVLYNENKNKTGGLLCRKDL